MPVTRRRAGLANRGYVSARLATPQSRQASEMRATACTGEDFQVISRPSVIHRQQDSLGLSVAGQVILSPAHSPGQARGRALASDNGTGVAAIVLGAWLVTFDQPAREATVKVLRGQHTIGVPQSRSDQRSLGDNMIPRPVTVHQAFPRRMSTALSTVPPATPDSCISIRLLSGTAARRRFSAFDPARRLRELDVNRHVAFVVDGHG